MRFNQAIAVVSAFALLGSAMAAAAEEGGLKIGIVDFEQAVTATDEGKAAVKEFERKKRDAEAKLQPMVEKYQELAKELDAKKFVLSEDALFQKQLDLAEMRNEIQTMQKQIQGRLEVDRERLVGPLAVKLREIVEELGRKEGFSLIIRRDMDGLMFTREALDITDLVIEKFNEKG